MTSPLNLLLIDTEDSRNLMHSADRATLGDDDWRCIRYDCELLDSGAESFASSGENQLNRDRKIFHNESWPGERLFRAGSERQPQPWEGGRIDKYQPRHY